MKKLLLSFLFIAAAFTTQAQEAKPTKEQTVDYLTNVLNNYSIEGERESGPTTRKIKIDKIQFTDCGMNISIYSKSTFGPDYVEKLTSYAVNLKDVESLEISAEKYGNSTFYYLSFKCYNNKKLINSSIESEKIGGNSYNPSEQKQEKLSLLSIIIPVDSEEKIIQALNHHRKLCGAPEPIQF